MDFIDKYTDLQEYYSFIIHNGQFQDIVNVTDILDDIIYINESMTPWVEAIISAEPNLDEKKSLKSKATLSDDIEKCIYDFKNLYPWDEESVIHFEKMLKEYKQELLDNKDAFSEQEYYLLLDEITISLDKISKFKNMIDDEDFGEKKGGR